jgi:uncharacterized protein (UPF0333 family)
MWGASTMEHKKKQKSRKGQNLIEYALVVAVIIGAVMAMSTYVFRSIQSTQQIIQKGYRD